MLETEIDITLLAGRRPDLLGKTLRSFAEKVFDNFRVNKVYANVDPFMGTDEDGEACVKIIRNRFPSADISAPATPHFSKAVQSLWTRPSSPIFFFLEDDWLVLENITPDQVFPLFKDNTRMASMLTREHGQGNLREKFRTTRKRVPFTPFKLKRPRFTMSPCFVERSFARGYAKLMNLDLDPERQNHWKDGRYNPELSRYCNQFRNASQMGRKHPTLVVDIGRSYQAEHGIEKVSQKCRAHWVKR